MSEESGNRCRRACFLVWSSDFSGCAARICLRDGGRFRWNGIAIRNGGQISVLDGRLSLGCRMTSFRTVDFILALSPQKRLERSNVFRTLADGILRLKPLVPFALLNLFDFPRQLCVFPLLLLNSLYSLIPISRVEPIHYPREQIFVLSSLFNRP